MIRQRNFSNQRSSRINSADVAQAVPESSVSQESVTAASTAPPLVSGQANPIQVIQQQKPAVGPERAQIPRVNTQTSSISKTLKGWTDEDYRALQQAATQIGVQAKCLVDVIQNESRGIPTARNPQTKATGLIQWMPNTAINLGTTIEQIAKMTIPQQLQLAVKYYKSSGFGKMNSCIDLYWATFYPVAKRYKNQQDFVLGSERSQERANTIAKQNPIFDLNKDQQITVQEFEQYNKNKHGWV